MEISEEQKKAIIREHLSNAGKKSVEVKKLLYGKDYWKEIRLKGAAARRKKNPILEELYKGRNKNKKNNV